ncbi:hypothetical protein ACFFX0_04625 [Citricoccus parietis]|uniref:Uncharacterized protein n=1 Tax=Citricoccus parietis TaxID=592307 RepID=A0ABV5FV19_9MICC
MIQRESGDQVNPVTPSRRSVTILPSPPSSGIRANCGEDDAAESASGAGDRRNATVVPSGDSCAPQSR